MIPRFHRLSATCSAATAHRLSSAQLRERCELLLSHDPPPSSLSSDELLEEIDAFVQKFVKPDGRSTSAREDNETISWFERVLDDLFPDLRSFQFFAERIDQLLGLPAPLPNVNANTDCDKIAKDLGSLSEEISSFRREKGISDVRVWQLQTRCSNFLSLCRGTNYQISQLQNQVAGVVNLSRSPSPPEENGEIRSQFTQIHHTIEDLLVGSRDIMPQQFVLIDSLNDSLVQLISECHQSMLKTFSVELSKLRATTEKFHDAALLSRSDGDRQLDAILGLLEKESLSKSDEAIRQDRLSRLKMFQSQYSVDQDTFLGEGSFAKVKRGQYSNQAVAIKITEVKGRGSSFSASMKKAIENEALLMSLCRHPCVLSIYGYCEVDPRTTHLILELGCVGSLWSVLEKTERIPSFPLSLSIAWIFDILSGLKYLHEQKILHQDVKAENVMLCDGLRCKLTDFGLSKQQLESSFGVPSRHHDPAGTLCFMAPEVRMGSRSSHRSDVYSCGVTCFQILFRSTPTSLRSVNSEILPMLESVLGEESWKRFARGCLAADCRERLSSREALELIGEIQKSANIGGDPRGCPTATLATPHNRHSDTPAVEVLSKVLISGRFEETETNDAAAVDRSAMVFPSPSPSIFSDLRYFSCS
jgi:serine/threonine protein kinase